MKHKWLKFLLSIAIMVQAVPPTFTRVFNGEEMIMKKENQAGASQIANKKILISGAGIAGLTLAYWLKQYGFMPTIIEKHPVLRAEGYKIDIRGVAVDVIRRMGLETEIFEARTQIREARYVDAAGSIVAQTHPDLCGARAGGDLEIVRGTLCQILFKQVGEVETIFGDSITQITQREDGAYVEFEKNSPRTFDLVIGADGLHSTVRKLVWGNELQFLRELGLYVAFYSIPNFLNLDCVEIEYHSRMRFVIAYCPRDGMAKVGYAFTAKPEQFNLRDKDQQQQFLKESFAGAGWEVPRFLEYMKESPDFYFDSMAQIHMPHWTQGRVALVGDAGYAVSPLAGQGASVALVGAYVLAGELAQAQGDYQQAFAGYEECMSEFIKQNQALTNISTMFMEGGILSWITSAIVWVSRQIQRFMPGWMIKFWKERGLRQTTAAANAIKLKSYVVQGR